MVTGPPGAGKTTVSVELANRVSPCVLVDGDRFFGFLGKGAVEPWLPEAHLQNAIVIEAAARATGRFVEDYDTIYDGVIGPWFLPTFASAGGIRALDYVIILPSVDTCVSQVSTRVGHGFSDETVTRRLHAEFDQAGVDRRHVLVPGGRDPVQTAAAILDAREAGLLHFEVDT